MTYGEIAEQLGDKTLARAVGQAMGENPTPIIMPSIACWRPAARPADFPPAAGSATSLAPADH